MTFFLLTYDPLSADGPDVVPFDDEEAAFTELERLILAKRPRHEIVLFRADSIETLKQTHSRYFYSASEIVAQMCDTTERLRDDIHASQTIVARS